MSHTRVTRAFELEIVYGRCARPVDSPRYDDLPARPMTTGSCEVSTTAETGRHSKVVDPAVHRCSESRAYDVGFLGPHVRCGRVRSHYDSSMVDVVAVNVGVPSLLGFRQGAKVYSAIAKLPVASGTTLWLSLFNLAGDGQADLAVHGGRDKAVYCYPSEHLAAWQEELGETLGPAPFGENLSTAGVLEADVCIGDRWRWGQAVMEVCQPRWPCFKLALYRQRADIQSRMRANGRTGWYLRVIEPGEVTVGSAIEVIERDPARLSVDDAHRAMSDRHLSERDLIERLAHLEALASEWRTPLQERLGILAD